MKKQLEIGDKIQRFENNFTKEVDFIYEIKSVTKTLAKSDSEIFKIELIYNTKKPTISKNKIIAMVKTKEKQNWSSPDYFLVEKNKL